MTGTDLGRDGRWQVEPVETAPFTTRLVVVRPDDPAAFNGTVIVLWNNVSAGYENFGGGDSPEVFENGYAYVAVSAQRVGIHGATRQPAGPARLGSGALRLAVDPERRLLVRHLHAGGKPGGARSAPSRRSTSWAASTSAG